MRKGKTLCLANSENNLEMPARRSTAKEGGNGRMGAVAIIFDKSLST